jgi:serine incorporator 1/3
MTVVDVEAGNKVAAAMQRGGGDDERRFMEGWCCACARTLLGPNPMVARYMYALIFLVTNLLAWTARDYGNFALAELQRPYPSLAFTTQANREIDS